MCAKVAVGSPASSRRRFIARVLADQWAEFGVRRGGDEHRQVEHTGQLLEDAQGRTQVLAVVWGGHVVVGIERADRGDDHEIGLRADGARKLADELVVLIGRPGSSDLQATEGSRGGQVIEHRRRGGVAGVDPASRAGGVLEGREGDLVEGRRTWRRPEQVDARLQVWDGP